MTDTNSKAQVTVRAYMHRNGAIWRSDNYPAGMDFTEDGWTPLVALAAQEKPEPGVAVEVEKDLYAYCGSDAYKWAEQFRLYAMKLGYSDMDHGWLIGWFANAIEYSIAIRSPSISAQAPAAWIGKDALERLEAIHEMRAGFTIVPVKMTADMINAWAGGLTVTTDEIAYRSSFQNAWSRVLAAAPSPDLPEGEVENVAVDRLLGRVIAYLEGSDPNAVSGGERNSGLREAVRKVLEVSK